MPKDSEGVLRSNARVRWIRAPKEVAFPRGRPWSAIYLRQVLKWLVRGAQDVLLSRSRASLAQQEYDLVFVNSIGGMRLHSGPLRQIPARHVLILRGSPSFYGDDRARLTGLVSELAKYDLIVNVAATVQKEWKQIGGLGEVPMTCIPNCCEEEYAKSIEKISRHMLRGHLNMDPAAFIAVVVANIKERKGHGILVRNIDRIVRAIPGIQFYFVGGIEEDTGRSIVEEIDRRRLRDVFHLVGPRRNAMEYIRAANALVLPTFTEAMPRVVLEAMALRTAVVASDVGGIPDLIEDGMSGFLFNIERPEDMVSKLAILDKDRERASALAQAASERYRQQFSRARQLARYRDLTDRLLASGWKQQ